MLDQFTRRQMLAMGACGSLTGWLGRLAAQAAEENTVKSCILLWMAGGPSHLDTFDLKPNPDHPVLWECDCRKYSKRVGGDDIQLEGANPSAEDAEEDSGEHEMKMVHDIEDQFRLQWLQDSPPSKPLFKSNLKSTFIVSVLCPPRNNHIVPGELSQSHRAHLAMNYHFRY